MFSKLNSQAQEHEKGKQLSQSVTSVLHNLRLCAKQQIDQKEQYSLLADRLEVISNELTQIVSQQAENRKKVVQIFEHQNKMTEELVPLLQKHLKQQQSEGKLLFAS